MRWQILIPITAMVSSFFSISVMWWAFQRRRERELYYRFELARLMLERQPDAQERVLLWLQEQSATDARKRRDTLRVLAWTLLLGGGAALAALGANPREDLLFGLLPIGVGTALFIYLFASRRES